MNPQKKPTNHIKYLLITAGMIACATVTGWIFRYVGFPETNIVIVYLLSILLTARFTKGYACGIAASVIATFSFNYFFTAPYYTLSVNDPTYIITFIIMTITAVITSTLTSKVKQNALDAKEKEAETSALFQLTNRLTDAADISDIAGISVDAISVIMDCRAALLCFDENGTPEHSFIQQQSNGLQIRRKTEDASGINHQIEGLRTAFIIGGEFHDWPIYGREDILGLLRIPNDTAVLLNEMQKRLLRSMIESTALAMVRFKQVIKVSEVRFMLLLLAIFVPITAFSLSSGLNMGIAEGLRRALFDVSSALSTTGYSTMSYASWPPLAIGVLILMMLIGGGIGSTAGGIKISRVYLMLRITLQNIRRRIFPTRSVEAPYYIKAQGRTPIDSSLALDTSGFISCYFEIFIIGTLLITITSGCSLTEAMFEFASALGTVGLSIGLTTTTTNNPTLVVEMVGMILGRLEIFIVLTGIYSVITSMKLRLTNTVPVLSN